MNGYVSEDRVIALAKAAGFEFAGRSDVNRNPKDTHDHKNGVWTLPPDLSVPQGEDRQKYVDIGESDRMTLEVPQARRQINLASGAAPSGRRAFLQTSAGPIKNAARDARRILTLIRTY